MRGRIEMTALRNESCRPMEMKLELTHHGCGGASGQRASDIYGRLRVRVPSTVSYFCDYICVVLRWSHVMNWSIKYKTHISTLKFINSASLDYTFFLKEI